MRFAFLEIATADDLIDLIGLLREGATVGVRAHPGRLYGPARALTAFEVGTGTPGIKKRILTLDTTRLDTFLTAFLAVSTPIVTLRVPDSPDVPVIREAWAVMNQQAGQTLSALAILKLALIIGRWVGTGRVEAQLAYGATDWVEFVKGGHGHLVLGCQPSARELQDFADYGAKGVCLGVIAEARHRWFAGMSGPYPMPLYGLIDHDPDHGVAEAVKAAQSPSDRPGAWDGSRRALPLLGLVRPFDEDIEAVKAVGWEGRQRTRIGKGHAWASPVLHVTRDHPRIPRADAGAWITAHWGEPMLYRVDFD